MAIGAFLLGEDFARQIGFAHERGNGTFYFPPLTRNNADSVVDLINNEWGIKAGRELSHGKFRGHDLSDPESLSSFLNEIVRRISIDVPEIQGVNFTPDMRSVQNLASDIGDSYKFWRQQPPVALRSPLRVAYWQRP